MKKLGKSIGKAFVFCAVMMLLCSFAYPLALTGISQVAMKEKANGNLIDKTEIRLRIRRKPSVPL